MKKTTKNRIGIIHYTCPPIVGGVEEIIKHHVGFLLNDGFEVRVIVGDGERFIDDLDLVIIPELKSDLGRSFDKMLQKKLEDSIFNATSNLDLVIVHNLMTMPFNLEATAAITGLSEKIPTIAWAHDLARFDPNYLFPNEDFPWSLLINRIPQITYVVISDYRKKQIEKLFGSAKDIRVIPDGVDIFSISNCDHELAEVLDPIVDQGSTALIPGRLVRRKNFELAIEIVAKLNKKIPFSLMITAPIDPHNPDTKNYHKELKKMVKELDIENRVIFLSERIDLTNWDRIRSLYLISDILLLTSKIEGFGLPVMEAAILKIPVCVSAIPPIENVIGKARALVFNLSDEPRDIAKKIAEKLSRSEEYRLRRRIIEEFGWKTIYKNKIRPLIDSMLDT